jgi:hypothetical protein
MASHPHDMFDDVPAELHRVGAHRAPVARRSGWFAFGWAALATGVLVGGGTAAILALPGLLGGGGPAAVPTATATAGVEPLTDPRDIDPARKISITILNGTSTQDLDQVAFDSLDEAGWPVATATEAEDRDTKTTTVFYADAADEAVARGLALALGSGSVRLTDQPLGAPVTVVLGADYAKAQTGE